MKNDKQIKSKKRVRDFAEVYTNEREVKAMCDLIPKETWDNIESTFLEPACVDCETEYFNGVSWVKISNYKNEKILCYNPKTKNALFDYPLRYVKVKTEEDMYLWQSPRLNMCLSKDHKVYYYDYKNRLVSDTAEKIYTTYYKDSNGFRGKIPNAFDYCGNLEVDEWLLRLAIACNADGRELGKIKKSYQIRVKKERKCKRLKMLLEKSNIEYKFKIYDGYYDFTFVSPLGCKIFPKEWFYLTKKLKEVFIDEISYWDGYLTKENIIQYSSSKKEDIDFVQCLASSIGYQANISYDKRRKKINYRIDITRNNYPALDRRHKDYFSIIKPFDGYKYCFTVNTGALVLRRSDKIFITGNCGNGNFLVEILSRKFKRCKDEKDGLKALASIVGIDIQADNCEESRKRLYDMYCAKFAQSNSFCRLMAQQILQNNIICGDSLKIQKEWIDKMGNKPVQLSLL